MNDRIITVALNWHNVVLLSMLVFAVIGARNGWQRGLVTLVSLFFAWGIAIKTVDFLIAAIKFAASMDFTGELRGFFQILLYMASVVMVVVTFNSKVIPTYLADRRDRISGISTGLLSGYFYIVLLLDLGREWIATHVEDWQFVFNSNISLDERFVRTVFTVNFTNNPYAAYDQLVRAQNLILLFLLLVFFHGLLFAMLGRVDRSLRPRPVQPPQTRQYQSSAEIKNVK
ncbi:MAG TPA: hypothetical protein VF707_06025 [Ardenticatenaceae bacterium]